MAARLKTMPTGPLRVVVSHLLADFRPDGDGMTDGELLARFLRSRDEDALAALVRRHAPMVWGVCCRLLRNHHDAEDAFQATFLVLVRKASDVPREAVANWLYGVARQTAVRVRATAAKRRRRETQVVNMPEPHGEDVRDADLQGVVDEELSRLPDHYRGVVVLCDLEGLTRKEAARQLGIPEGSVASRLARARALLAKRLSQRGIVFSGSVATVFSAGSGSASAPPALVASTIKAASLLAAGQAAGVVSVQVAALTEGVVKVMFVSKLKAALSVVLVLGFIASGATFLTFGTAAGQDEKKPAGEKAVQPAVKQEAKADTPVPKQEKKEELTAWGKEVGGLQAGLGFRVGERRAYRHGETVKVVLRVRNVGKEAVEFKHISAFFIENPPKITDADGKIVQLPNYRTRDQESHMARSKNVLPGKEVDLYEWTFDLQPKIEHSSRSFIPGTGQFSLQCDRIVGSTWLNPDHPNPTLDKLATGSLKLEVKDAKKLSDKEAPEKKVDLLQGEWAVTAWQDEGENASADELKGKKVVIKGNVMSGVQSGISGSMSFKLNPEKTPNEIDFTVLDGKRKGITEAGIYKIEGDQLRICFGGKARPKEFATTAGSGRTLLTLQKEPLTAWGKEVGGLQAGLSISNASDIQLGGKATVVLRLRNVSNDPITASAWPLWLIKPTIVDGAGKQVRTTSPSSPGFDLSATDITLKPGQTVVVATNNIFVMDADAKGGVRHEGVADQFTVHVRPGRHSIALKGFLEGRPTVATGTVDFEVKTDKTEKPDAPATKPNNGPANAEKPLEQAAKQELPVTNEEKLKEEKLFEIPQTKNEGGPQGGGYIPLMPTKRP